jgi:hypothetical protein
MNPKTTGLATEQFRHYCWHLCLVDQSGCAPFPAGGAKTLGNIQTQNTSEVIAITPTATPTPIRAFFGSATDELSLHTWSVLLNIQFEVQFSEIKEEFMQSRDGMQKAQVAFFRIPRQEPQSVLLN